MRKLATVALLSLCSVAFAQSPPKPNGRYVAITPPGDSANGFANFLWVLDTQSGNVIAYRIANMTDNGKSLGFATIRIPSEDELVRRLGLPE